MYLQIENIAKKYGSESVLDDLNLQVEQHRVMSVLGRSGSGKTTLLRIIAGLEQPDEGKIFLDGKILNTLPPHRRNVVYLYQEALLFPHLDVFENIAFGLRLRKEPEDSLREKTLQMIDNLELRGQESKMPEHLSGGQRQRVSFGRALIINPKVLLLDEPFGALDVDTRSNMQQLYKRIARTFRITTLFVTHDLKEALLMGDDLCTIRGGRLKLYPDKKSFIDDAETGVRGEMEFWKNLT